jgi:hypothetical protein
LEGRRRKVKAPAAPRGAFLPRRSGDPQRWQPPSCGGRHENVRPLTEEPRTRDLRRGRRDWRPEAPTNTCALRAGDQAREGPTAATVPPSGGVESRGAPRGSTPQTGRCQLVPCPPWPLLVASRTHVREYARNVPRHRPLALGLELIVRRKAPKDTAGLGERFVLFDPSGGVRPHYFEKGPSPHHSPKGVPNGPVP